MRAAVHVDRPRQPGVLAHDQHLIAALHEMKRRGVRLDAAGQRAVAVGHDIALAGAFRLRGVACEIEPRLRGAFGLLGSGGLRGGRERRARKLRGETVEAA